MTIFNNIKMVILAEARIRAFRIKIGSTDGPPSRTMTKRDEY
jgi:hypothetical protein